MRKREWLKEMLDALGQTQAKLAKHMGVGAPRVNEIIKGTREVSPIEIVQIAGFFNVPEISILERITGQALAGKVGNSPLSLDERELVEIYRRIPAEARGLAMGSLRGMAGEPRGESPFPAQKSFPSR